MNTTWLYKQTERQLWTVGFYSPDGKWNPESDHDNPTDAADRVHYLNGGVKVNEIEINDRAE